MSSSTVSGQFEIVLQKGIERGFAPPTPTALYVITHTTRADVFTVSTQLRPLGTPQLGPANKKELKVADHAESLTRLLSLLRDLPVQYPGADDIYGRNISIMHKTGPGAAVDFFRSGPELGAVCAVSLPTEEQKAQFDEAVAIIVKLGG